MRAGQQHRWPAQLPRVEGVGTGLAGTAVCNPFPPDSSAPRSRRNDLRAARTYRSPPPLDETDVMTTVVPLRRRISAVLFAVVTVFTIVLMAPSAGHAAGPRPLFQLPVGCGETWRLGTYIGHDDYQIDMFPTSGSAWGRPILASYGGTVIKAGIDGELGTITPSNPGGQPGSGGGHYVKIDHGNGWQTLYLHMLEWPMVSVGQRVTIGQQIGKVGSTGRSRAAHLHYEQEADGRDVESWFNGVPSGITHDNSEYSVYRDSNNCGSPAPSSPVPAGQAVVHEGYTSVFTINASNGHLQETYLTRLGGAWATQDLSVTAGTPSVAGQPVAVVHDGYTSVFTVNASNGHLQETYLTRVGSAWVTQDLGAVAVGQTPSVSVHDGYVSVFTVTSAGQIQETYLSRLGAGWVTQPLPGAVVAPYTSVVTHDGYVSVFAVTTDGRVQETYLVRVGAAWVAQDLGVSAAAQVPSAVVHDGYVSVFTVTPAGQLQETYLARIGAAWVTQALTGNAVKPATSAVVHDGYVSVFAATTGGRLQETYLARLGTAWVSQDLTTNPGTPLMAGRPVTVTHDGYTSVFTINATGGHVQETYLPRIGAAWATHDLTTTAGTPAAKP
ncbi:peptidoglycan DD-metalloendopeptidase family protein [Micromonospora vinacea]|uniref:peptidoglycan DD-metalloendopeptidase family protein n=1 Tax=Micromonospora vinacea TaxID=709878 RepID=UPI00344DAAD9